MSPPAINRCEPLIVAMTLAPGVFSRNRHFELYRHGDAVRARRRAAELRGIARQLGTLTIAELSLASRPDGVWTLSFAAPEVSLRRECRVTRAELAALRTVIARAGSNALGFAAEDGAIVAAMLAQLPEGFDRAGASGEGRVAP